MKYYIYVSDSKVDMLAAQIPEKTLRALVRRLELSVCLPWLPLKATYKPGDPMPSDSHRIERLGVVENALDPNDVGSLTDSRPWIRSSLDMSFGYIDSEMKAVWFLGEVAGVSVVMGGSATHLLGSANVDQQPHNAHSLLPALLRAVGDWAEARDELGRVVESPDVVRAARLLVRTMKGPRVRLGFLARRLLTESDEIGKIIFASPLYVASDAE